MAIAETRQPDRRGRRGFKRVQVRGRGPEADRQPHDSQDIIYQSKASLETAFKLRGRRTILWANPRFRVVVPHRSGDIKRGVLRSILRQADMSAERLIELL